MAPPDDTPRSLAAGTEEAQQQEATSTKKESTLSPLTSSPSESLFERLGGSSAVKSVVDDFYTRCVDDPYLAKFFDTSKLSALKYHQLKFLKVAFTKIPDDLDVTALMLDKHRLLFRDRGLNATHFDRVCLHLVASLDSAGATPELIDEAANILLPLRPVFELGEQKYGAGSGSDTSSEEEKVNAAESESAEPKQYGSHAVLHSDARSASSTAAPQTNENRATLSDRLGGNDALRAAVAGLYQKILDDDELSIFFQDVNMTALKLHQIEFLKVAFGQVPDNLDVSGLMLSKHRRLFEAGLNEVHFDRVASHLVATLADLNVPEALIDEAVGIVGPLRAVFEQGALEAQTRAKQ
jgi:hemoglobin